MLSDALQLLFDVARESKDLQLIDLNRYQKIQYVPGTEPKVIEVDPDALYRRLDTFESFLTYVADRAKVGPDAKRAEGNTIPHDGSAVFYCDKTFLYSEQPYMRTGLKARFDVKEAEPYAWLKTHSAKWTNQIEFVRLLRITLRDVLPAGNFLSIIRDVKFINNSGGSGNIQHGKQSLSREIVQEVSGTGAIPEELTLNVQPFENIQFKANVECAVEIDESNCTFRLMPFPGQLRKCVDEVLERCLQSLDGAAVKSYYGAESV